MLPIPIELEKQRFRSSSTIGSHAGVCGDMVEVIHFSFGLMTTTSMSGSPIPLSSTGVVKVVFLIASGLPCLKKFRVADWIDRICSCVGTWNWAW